MLIDPDVKQNLGIGLSKHVDDQPEMWSEDLTPNKLRNNDLGKHTSSPPNFELLSQDSIYDKSEQSSDESSSSGDPLSHQKTSWPLQDAVPRYSAETQSTHPSASKKRGKLLSLGKGKDALRSFSYESETSQKADKPDLVVCSLNENAQLLSDGPPVAIAGTSDGNTENSYEANCETPISGDLHKGEHQHMGKDDSYLDGQSSRSEKDQGRDVQRDLVSSRSGGLAAGLRHKFATVQKSQIIRATETTLASLSSRTLSCSLQPRSRPIEDEVEDIAGPDAESKLPLIVAKEDFATMRVVGQFNLGFIIAVRPKTRQSNCQTRELPIADELFIIDQHASDEKYNFERLQANTIVQSQRLVHPKLLQLTALEEEIVLENLPALDANGFKIQVDSTGDSSVGARCQLLALPLSRETTFTVKDLEELITLLGEEPSGSQHIPRPSRVRKMFAMRACRSSIMIGKALTSSQMYSLLRHMGELDKPWNCPHGRPTMRHLYCLQAWDKAKWDADLPGSSTSRSWLHYAMDD
jgi:DNA mismatch repair ATPase MutL